MWSSYNYHFLVTLILTAAKYISRPTIDAKVDYWKIYFVYFLSRPSNHFKLDSFSKNCTKKLSLKSSYARCIIKVLFKILLEILTAEQKRLNISYKLVVLLKVVYLVLSLAAILIEIQSANTKNKTRMLQSKIWILIYWFH